MAEDLICQDCGAPGLQTIRHDENHNPIPDAIRCMPCLSKFNKTYTRSLAPEAWAKALAEVRVKREAKLKVEGVASEEVAKLDPQQIDAAVQRLMQEAKRLERPAPTPKSPRWIGRDLEREGWSRKMLLTAVAQALDDGDLVMGHFYDARGNRKDELLPAVTGVATRFVFEADSSA